MDPVPITKKLIAFGSKQIYLWDHPLSHANPHWCSYSPKFTIALTRTPTLSPYHARFLVPLNFSKYDLRDYLYHAYNVKCHNIRSYVRMMPVRDAEDTPRHFFREESKKYMTVEMETPFVWPKEPENYEEWGQTEARQQARDMRKDNGTPNKADRLRGYNVLRDQAKKLLGSEETKKGKAAGKAVEKEQDMEKVSEAKADRVVKKARKRHGRGEAKADYSHLLKRWEEQRTPMVTGRPSAWEARGLVEDE
jgi:large subunit ribosomal protein L23